MGKGSPSTAGTSAAAAEANALQRQIYEESIERGEPFYKVGTSGIQTLSDYLGLEGGASTRTRQDILEELRPEYTTQITERYQVPEYKTGQITTRYDEPSIQEKISQKVDYDALNAAVEAQLAQQQTDRPEYFGQLLTPFGTEQFEVDPGFQFRQQEGQKALERRLAAQGKTFSPEAAKALADYNQQLAAQEYGQAYGRYTGEQQRLYNMLAGISGVGQAQQTQQTAAGQQMAGQIGQTQASLASAQMAAQQAGAARRQSTFNTLAQIGGTLGAVALMSDINVKENIEFVRKEKGFNIYEYNYIGDNKRYRGVIAQEIMEEKPDAVVFDGEHYLVNYDKLGLEMEVVN